MGVRSDLRKRLTPLIRKTQPYTKRIAHKGIWVEPELLAEIEYRAKSAEGKVRHPSSKACGRTCDEVVRSLRELPLFEPALVRRSRLRLRRGRGAVSDLQRDGRTDHARDAGRRRTS